MIDNYPLIYPIWIEDLSVGGMYDGNANVFVSTSSLDNDVITKLKIGNGLKEVTGLFVGEYEVLNRYRKRGLLKSGILSVRTDCSDASIDSVLAYADNRANQRKITIELTEECNLRCKYCRYTINEKEKSGKQHGSLILSVLRAEKFIVEYLEKYLNHLEKIPIELRNEFEERNPPSICFYGGEALLRKDELLKLIILVKTIGKNYNLTPRCVVTTNGTLLTEEVIDFFVTNDVLLAISIDGPEYENDKNRVFNDGTGSFSFVERALEIIKRKYPNYLLEKVSIQAVDAPNYDKNRVIDFFTGKTVDGKFAGVSNFMLLEFTDFENQDGEIIDIAQVKIDSERIFKSAMYLFDEIGSASSGKEIITQISQNPILKDLLKKVVEMDMKIGEKQDFGKNYFNTCYLGKANMIITSDGKYHICERTDFSMSIGDIDNGIDYTRVRNLYKEYFQIMNRESCRGCWAGLFCPFCVAVLIKGGKVMAPSELMCEQIRCISGLHLKIALALSHKYPHIYSAITKHFKLSDDATIDQFLNDRQKTKN